MDDFARLMESSGVQRMGAHKPQGATRHASPPRHTPPPRPTAPRSAPAGRHGADEPEPPMAVPQSAREAWVAGDTARSALDVALQRVRDGDGSGWAIAILADGTTRALPTHQGRSTLLSTADRLRARLIIVASGAAEAGQPFTYVLHPSKGVATLDNDPGEPA